MRERCANHLQTLSENQRLKRNLKLYHEGDFLRNESLKSLHSQLELLRDDNKRLEEKNEQLEWAAKSLREQIDSSKMREALKRNLRKKEREAKATAAMLG